MNTFAHEKLTYSHPTKTSLCVPPPLLGASWSSLLVSVGHSHGHGWLQISVPNQNQKRLPNCADRKWCTSLGHVVLATAVSRAIHKSLLRISRLSRAQFQLASGFGVLQPARSSRKTRLQRAMGCWLDIILGPGRTRTGNTSALFLPGAHVLRTCYVMWKWISTFMQFDITLQHTSKIMAAEISQRSDTLWLTLNAY